MQAKTINLLLRLQREFHLSYLFITHDLSLMRNVATRVAIMYLGKICELAETADFFQNPLHPYTQMLLSSIPVISAEEEELKPRKVDLDRRNTRARSISRADAASIPAVPLSWKSAGPSTP